MENEIENQVKTFAIFNKHRRKSENASQPMDLKVIEATQDNKGPNLVLQDPLTEFNFPSVDQVLSNSKNSGNLKVAVGTSNANIL